MKKHLLLNIVFFTFSLFIQNNTFATGLDTKYLGDNRFQVTQPNLTLTMDGISNLVQTYATITLNELSSTNQNRLILNIDDQSKLNYVNDIVAKQSVSTDIKTFLTNAANTLSMQFTEADIDNLVESLKNNINDANINTINDLPEYLDIEDLTNFINYIFDTNSSPNFNTYNEILNVIPQEQARLTEAAVDSLHDELSSIENSKSSTDTFRISTKRLVEELKKHQSNYFNLNPDDTKENYQPFQRRERDAETQLQIANVNNMQSIVSNRTNIHPIVSGVSAGDMIDSQAIWVKGTLATGIQGDNPKIEGYKFKTHGITIGYEIGDKHIAGVAFSYFLSDTKGKINPLTKNDFISAAGTLYGKYSINNRLFISAQGSYGKSNIKKKRNNSGTVKTVITGKTNSTNLSGRLELGYDYTKNQKLHLIPTVGLSFIDVRIDKYKEKGTGILRGISKRTIARNSFIAGINMLYIVNSGGKTEIIPEIHGNISNAIKTQNSDTIITIIEELDPIKVSAEKLAKTSYNLGSSIKTIHNNNKFEISLGYDLGLAKKFTSHEGNMKLKMNF